MSSLQTRLALWLISSVVLLFGLHWLLASYAPRAFAESYVLSRLQHDAEGLLVGLRLDQGRGAQLDSRYIAPIYSRPYSGHYYLITTDEARLRSRSLWDRELPLPPAAELQEGVLHLSGEAGEPLLVWIQRFEKDGRPVLIAVAEDLSELERRIAAFHWLFALVTLAALLILVLAQQVIVRFSLRPLDRLREECRQLEAGRRAGLSESVPREVQPLVREINRLLGLQQQRLERSRQALGNLAHALKTPLTFARQVTDRLGEGDTAPASSDLRRALDGMGAIVDRELRRARLAGAAAPGRRLNLHAELQDLIGLLGRIYADKNISVNLAVPEDKMVQVDREDLLELLGNLLDNAYKWAERRIAVTVEAAPGLRLRIEDDGPGVEGAALERLAARGLRLDETRPGQGLGLAIAHDIVTRYGGELGFATSPTLGGLQVSVYLPT